MAKFDTPVGFVNGLRAAMQKRGLKFDEKKYDEFGDDYQPIKDGKIEDVFDLQTGLEDEFGIELDNDTIQPSSTVVNLHKMVQSEMTA